MARGSELAIVAPRDLNLPSATYLRSCFTYDLKTGILRWKMRPRQHFVTARAHSAWNGRFAGMQAGRIKHGHVSLDRSIYKIHRIVWKLMTGKEPPITIDHKDGNPLNNTWTNLRSATKLEQMWNLVLRKSNSSGFRGVHKHRCGKWQATIRIGEESPRYLGLFPTPEEASAAYETAAKQLHGEFFLPHGKRQT